MSGRIARLTLEILQKSSLYADGTALANDSHMNAPWRYRLLIMTAGVVVAALVIFVSFFNPLPALPSKPLTDSVTVETLSSLVVKTIGLF